MKKLYFTLLTALLLSLPALANNVIVKGYVTFSNGSPAANQLVYVSTDSMTTPSGCSQTHSRYTNANGFYIDTLSCSSGNIVKVWISVLGCGTVISENPQVNTATNLVERNFTLPCSPQTSCHADFNFTVQGTTNQVAFMSTSTAGPVGYILSYRWNFGDGPSVTVTTSTIFHSYNAPGTYNVSLIIETSGGCRDTIIKSVTINNSAGTCHAQFADSMIQPNKFYFFSGGSTTSAGSTIVQRIWSFGDGTGNTGNNATVDHIYQHTGTYNVCLRIVSSSGCVDSLCKTVTVASMPTDCHANFQTSVQPSNTRVIEFRSTSTSAVYQKQYLWSFGDGSSWLDIYGGGMVDHFYSVRGSYQACLTLISANGCRDSICKTVIVPDSTISCHANYSYNVSATGEVHFTNGSTTLGTVAQYYWHFGTLGMSNAINPVFTLPPGTHNVCLAVYSSGCADSICKTITIAPPPPPTNCISYFTYENLPFTNPAQRQVRFNSTPSTGAAGDSIISRKWQFGDGSSLTGNVISPVHNYALPGSYNVCLTIKTASNCEKTVCKLVIVTQVNSACVPHFTWQRTAPKQATFNSSASWVPVGDTIVQRRWNFGDGSQLLTGNVISPVHNYLFNGVYTVSLRIITSNHCEQTFTIPVILQDSTLVPPTSEPIRIISLFPNPAQAQTQAVVWSLHNNVQAELAIYDVYGTKKWSINKILLQGNNMTVIPTAFLVPGPYYLRVTTAYGVKTRPFFKR
jgi:PKD repeat protein